MSMSKSPNLTREPLRLNYDIIHHIIQFLNPWLYECGMPRVALPCTENEGALVRTAQTCKALSEIALPLLWRQLDDIGNLLCILPAFKKLWADKEPQRFWALCGEILPSDWARFQKYARYVRVLSLLGTSTLEPSVFTHLYHFNQRQALLPSLQRLEYGLRMPFDTVLLTLACPSIRVLIFERARGIDVGRARRTAPQSSAIEWLFRNACREMPFLEEIDISDVSSAAFQQPVVQCGHLRKVAFSSLEPVLNLQLLRDLSSLPKLVELRLTLRPEDENIGVVCSLHSLQTLSIQGRLSRMLQFVDWGPISAPRLHSFAAEITWSSGRSPDECRRLLVAVRSRYGKNLRGLRLETHSAGREADDHWPFQSIKHVIGPLLDMRNLEVVLIKPPPRWYLTFSDNEIRDITTAWPNLVDFTISVHPADAYPTLSGLMVLATRSVHLRKLWLSYLDISHIPSLETYPALSHQLQSLEIGDEHFGPQPVDVRRVHMRLAQFLDRIFPNLDSRFTAFRGEAGFLGENTDCPELIQALRTLQSARRQQRAQQFAQVT